jgi:hypothetical protein
MANQIYIPKLNPIRFYEYPFSQQAQYESKHFDDVPFADQLMSWQTRTTHKQKWTINDTVPFQFEGNFDSIQIQVIDCNETLYHTSVVSKVAANTKIPGFFIYEKHLSLASFAPGVYFFLLTLGGTTQLISEPQQIFSSLPDSLLFEYKNSSQYRIAATI